MSCLISVIIPTYNPNYAYLLQTLEALKAQTIEKSLWELIIVDNNSAPGHLDDVDISWCCQSRIVSEPRQGLTNARLKGFSCAQGNIIIMVDDDNLLEKNYLANAAAIFKEYIDIGAAGGKSIPIFESPPPKWLYEFYGNLALRNLGDESVIEHWANKFPNAAPIGAGMVIRKEALKKYIEKAQSGQLITGDRNGDNLSSGGDNDIVLEILKSGWMVGYFPGLSLQHIIPNQRVKVDYLAKLVRQTNASWIKLLDEHHLNPWKKIPRFTVPLRKLKAWFRYRAWQGKAHYVRWHGACGMFEGLSDIS